MPGFFHLLNMLELIDGDEPLHHVSPEEVSDKPTEPVFLFTDIFIIGSKMK